MANAVRSVVVISRIRKLVVEMYESDTMRVTGVEEEEQRIIYTVYSAIHQEQARRKRREKIATMFRRCQI